MSKFNEKIPSNETENIAGGVAYKHSPEMELIVSCLSTFLEDKFYESGNERMTRIKSLLPKVKPEFIAKLAIVARRDFHLRSVTSFLLGELSRLHRGDSLTWKAINLSTERPDDLIELVAYLKHPIPKQVKKGIRRSLLKFSAYQLAKYKSESKKVKLVDLLNLAHPNPKFANEEQKQAWKDLIEGKLKNTETWESRLSSGEDKGKVWKNLIAKNSIGYMALLRNLRNISEQADTETIEKACMTIANRDNVKKSKQLPFRFYNAYENVKNQKMLNAISEAMDCSVDNVPELEGQTLIGIDCSGSMQGDSIKKASIFAAALMKKNDSDVILYDTSIQEFKYLSNMPVLALSEKIQKEAMGGGTETSLVFEYANKSQKKYDRIIILSDNESWVEYGGVNEFHKQYRKLNNCYIYAIDIAGYGTKDIKGDKVFHLTGWSERIFDYIHWIEKENGLVDFINQIEII
jgi:hypothetical protein